MSSTEMVAFQTDGTPKLVVEFENSWRGAMAIWFYIDEKYLPPFKPSFVDGLFGPDIEPEDVEEVLGYKPSRTADKEAIREIWRAYHLPEISQEDRIVLGSTFDRALVKKEHFPDVIAAFIACPEESSLKEQASVIGEWMKDPDIIAVGWNQTSVTANQWTRDSYDETLESYIPYNCLLQDNHFWLVEDQKEPA